MASSHTQIGDTVLDSAQIEMLETLKGNLETPVAEAVPVEETVAQILRPAFGGNADPAPKVPYSGPKSGKAAGPWKGPRVVMRWGKVTKSYREPVKKTQAQIDADRSYRASQGGW